MRVLVVLCLLLCCAIILLGIFMPTNASLVTLDGLLRAWKDTADPSLDSITINAMLEIKSYVTAFLIVAIPSLLGGLAVFVSLASDR